MVPAERIELPTFGLQNRCTTAVLRRPTALLASAPAVRQGRPTRVGLAHFESQGAAALQKTMSAPR